MSESTNQPAIENKGNSIEVYKGKFLVVLSKIGVNIQKMHDAESQLVYNKDGLEGISKFVEEGKKALAALEEDRKIKKAPILLEGKNIDSGAKLLSDDLQMLVDKADRKKQQISAEIAAEALLLQQAADKKEATLKAIDNFIMNKSTEISGADTILKLLEIERLINLESGSAKYGEHLPLLKSRIEAIRPLIATQKLAVRDLSKIDSEASQAAENGNDERVLELLDKKDEVKANIEQNRTNIVEAAVGQSSNSGYAEQMITAAPKRKTYTDWEVRDIKKLLKSNPELVIVSPNVVEIDKIVKELRTSGRWPKGQAEYISNGIRFFEVYKY